MRRNKVKNKDGRFKLKSSLLKNKNLIIEQLKKEWEEAESVMAGKKKKEQLIQLAKDAGIAIGKGLLVLLLIGGFLTVAAAAPNIFSAFGRLGNNRRYFKKEQFNKDKYYLKRHGLIKIKQLDQNTFEISLTEKGANKALEEAFKNFIIKKPQKDGYWRVVMFDIPRKDNWARDVFRQKLKMMGFYQLQESVFILPYPCEKEVNFLVEILGIAPFVNLIRTKDFAENENLKKAFGQHCF